MQKLTENPTRVAVRDLYDASKINKNWRNGSDGLQPKACDDMKTLWKMTEEARGAFAKKSEGVAEKFKELNPILLKRKNLKGEARAKEKLREDEADEQKRTGVVGKYWDEKTDTYHCRELKDVDGHTFCVKDVSAVAQMLKHFESDKDIVRIKNNFAKPSDLGYSDINMNVKLPNAYRGNPA